jgi:hypothetical protein
VKFFEATARSAVSVLALSLVALTVVHAADKKKDQGKGSQTIDKGEFGIFVKGQRVANETFTIHQESDASVIKSELKETVGSDPNSQKSDLEINSKGELLRYEWSQSSGGSLSVFPDNDFLKERIFASGSAKPAEQAYLLPSSSSILDNNFFIHREILIWRFLAADCKPDTGGLKCQQDPGEFGVLIPQDRTSIHVRLELVGKEKVTIRGAERELLRLNLKGENFQWALWVDDKDQFKLIRASIPADNTEVVRE